MYNNPFGPNGYVRSHELGHNFGMLHDGRGADMGTPAEYGDRQSDMGMYHAVLGHQQMLGYNAAGRYQMGVLPSTE
eukprot:1942026-Prymnesium_polylepis.1